MARQAKIKYPLWRILGFLLAIALMVIIIIQSSSVQKLLYPYPYRAVIEDYASQYGVDPLLVVAVIREESKFVPASESHKGAQGLMQLMPTTAEWIAAKIGDSKYSIESLREPNKNIRYGTWYLANLEKEFNGNIILTLAAYNGGRGHVQQWIATKQIKLNNIQVEDIPFEETREYANRVLNSYDNYRRLYYQN